jgi:putative transposase
MGQSIIKNYVHLIFSTKHRQPFIQPFIETRLHEYMAGICRNLECDAFIVGGHVDHIHVLCCLSKKVTLAKLVEEIKGHSSRWIKTQDPSLQNFYWQNGYAAFSVNTSGIPIVTKYIANQHTHHHKQSFQDEFMHILQKHEAEYDGAIYMGLMKGDWRTEVSPLQGLRLRV